MKLAFKFLVLFIFIELSSLMAQSGVVSGETKELKKIKTRFRLDTTEQIINEIVIRADRPSSAASSTYLNKLDFENRLKNSAQDLLRLVPGLFIAQHAGGGKAEQIFIRGFDSDHGTDVATYVDGMPVNLPSHGHGQGYADLHFLISETVKGMDIFKGPYQAQFGNFSTAAAVQFNTLDSLTQNLFLIENTIVPNISSLASSRVAAMLKLPFSSKKIHSYFAVEGIKSRSYFEKSQHLNRFNLFFKILYQLDQRRSLSFGLSNFTSSWDASGQVPERAVTMGLINRFGSIDPSEGGETGRSNLNLIYKVKTKKGEFISQLYASNYRFKLYSNFTFFLKDSILGDQIEQGDQRDILGINVKYSLRHKFLNWNNKLVIGSNLRYDDIKNDLWHSSKRNRINAFSIADIKEMSSGFYFNEIAQLNEKWRLELGARFDFYHFLVVDQLPSDSLRMNFSGMNYQRLFSPKINLSYRPSDRFQFFMNIGKGFHSNDARSTVLEANNHQLPKSIGAELGSLIRIGKNGLISVAFWTLNLENELVYVGDEGTTENKGSSRRNGIDLSIRWQVTANLFFDGDLNVSNNFFTNSLYTNRLHKSDLIPLAPTTTYAGGISYKYKKTIFNLRYRYMADRPANESNSVIAKGYGLMDLNLTYKSDRFKIGLGIENVLNKLWNEAQFDTESKLKNEKKAVSELHFTPGTPFNLKISISYLF